MWTALVLLAVALPWQAASARAEAALALDGPSEANLDDGVALAEVRLVLRLADFGCSREERVAVRLAAEANGTQASLNASQVVLAIPPGSYLNEPFVGVANVTLRAWGTGGDVVVRARFDDPLDQCVTVGKMRPADASWTMRVAAASFANETRETEGTPPPGDANETPPPPRPARRPEEVHPDARYVGDARDDPPAESTRAIPAAGLLAAALGVAGAAALRRRQNR